VIRTQIYLTEEEHAALGRLAAQVGQGRSEIIRMAIDAYLACLANGSQLLRLRAAQGIWAHRDDLPDLRESRAAFDRY
jgi:hypothetical protein